MTITSRARCQAEVKKMDGVDSSYEFIAPPESIENKYIHRNYEARDQNERLTFYIPLTPSLSLSLSLSLSGVGTAAGYMKTIHHCIIYHKIIDSEEGEELLLAAFYTVGPREESHGSVKA